jgi:hypothetical protein
LGELGFNLAFKRLIIMGENAAFYVVSVYVAVFNNDSKGRLTVLK